MSDCFDRRNNENPNQFPCGTSGDSGLKSCCTRGDLCAGNGLCISTDDQALTPYFIHGCTIDNWDDLTCPTQCYNSTGNGIKPYGGGKFCCFGRRGCNCEDEENVFSMDPIRIVASIPPDTSRAPTSASVRSTSVSTSADGTSSLTISVAPTTSSVIVTTSTVSIPVNDRFSNSPADSPENSSNRALPVGLGVGLGVGIPLLFVIVALIWLLTRKKRTSNATTTSTAEQHLAYHGHYAPPKPYDSATELDGQARTELP